MLSTTISTEVRHPDVIEKYKEKNIVIKIVESEEFNQPYEGVLNAGSFPSRSECIVNSNEFVTCLGDNDKTPALVTSVTCPRGINGLTPIFLNGKKITLSL